MASRQARLYLDYMRRNVVIWISVVVVLVAAAGAYYYLTYLAQPSNIRTSKSDTGFPALPSTNPTTPVGPVAISALSTTSIVVQVNDTGDLFTYAIGTSTHMYSLALEGKPGKTFADLEEGMLVTIYPQQGDSGTALGIAFPRDPSLVPTKEEVENSVSGTVSAVTADAVTVTPASGAPVSIALTSSTKLYTTVIEGQSGRALAVGERVGVTGLTTVGGKTTATMILIAPDLTK